MGRLLMLCLLFTSPVCGQLLERARVSVNKTDLTPTTSNPNRTINVDGRSTPFPPELDSYVSAMLHEWEVPGAAVAIVKDGQVITAKGYGVRQLGNPEQVDGQTMFDIASITKTFTAAMVATLVDEGKLGWDKPVREYLPSLQFSDPYLDANVTLRDLLSHRTGLRNNSAPFRGHLTRAQVIALFRHLQPSEPFRSHWVYSNIGYAAVGEIASAAGGSTWEELLTKRIIQPLGMSRTTAEYEAVPSMGNYAWGHVEVAGRQQAIPRGSERLSTAAAGAVHSCAHDLATWMLFQLGDGSFAGRRVIIAQSMEEMQSPQIFVPTTPQFRTARQLQRFAAYGLGWQVFDYRGHLMLWHSGNGDGQAAYLLLLPEDNLGVAVLTNSWRPGMGLNSAIASRVMDHYLGLPSRDYAAEFRASWGKNASADKDQETKLAAARIKNTAPTLPLAAYVGLYRDQLGLDVQIVQDGDRLRLRYAGGQLGNLAHWHRDTFRLSWDSPFSEGSPTFVDFDIDEYGKVSRLRMELMHDRIDASMIEPRK